MHVQSKTKQEDAKMFNVNREPIPAKIIGSEVLFDRYSGEQYVFLAIEGEGEVVAPKQVVYGKSDGRYAINFTSMQESAIRLQENESVDEAISKLQPVYSIEDDMLRDKFNEYGIIVKHVEETKNAKHLITNRNKKVTIRQSNKTLVNPYQGLYADTDMIIVIDGEDYYILPKAAQSGHKSTKDFYLSQKIIDVFGPNAWSLLEYLTNDRRAKEIDEQFKELKKRGKAPMSAEERKKKDEAKKRIYAEMKKTKKPAKESVVGTLKGLNPKQNTSEFIEEVTTHPLLSLKHVTFVLNEEIDLVCTYQKGIALNKSDCSVELSQEDIKNFFRCLDLMKDFCAINPEEIRL